MSRTKKPRKAYKPRYNAQAGGLIALGKIGIRAQDKLPMIDAQVTDILASSWLALTNMTHGTASMESWATVTFSLNVALILTEQVFERQYEADFIAALDGAFAAKLRGDKGGAYRLSGDELKAVRFALEIHDEQLKLVTQQEMRAALAEYRRRLDEGIVYGEVAPA